MMTMFNSTDDDIYNSDAIMKDKYKSTDSDDGNNYWNK